MPIFSRLTQFIQNNQIVKNISTTFVVSIILQAFGVITGMITARSLGPTGKGILTAIILWPGMLASIGSVGITEALSYFVSRKPEMDKQFLATSLILGVIQSVCLILLGIIVIPIVLRDYSSEHIRLGLIYLAYIPLNFGMLYIQNFLGGKLLFREVNIIRFSLTVLMVLGLVFFFAINTLTIEKVIFVYLAAYFLTLIVAIALAARHHLISFHIKLHLIRPLLSYGIKAHLSTITAWLNNRLDQMIISIFLPPEELGHYAVAVTLTTVVTLVGSTLSIVALPTISKKAAAGNANRTISYFVQLAFWGSAAIGILTALLAPQIILFFFGSAYTKAISIASILCIASIPLSTNTVLQTVLKAENLPLRAGISEIVALTVTLLSLTVFLPRFGILGAAIASFLAYLAAFAYMLRSIRKSSGLSLSELFIPNRESFLSFK